MTTSSPAMAELAAELEGKAREYRAIAYDTAIRQAAEHPLNDGTAAALEEIAAQVRQIDGEAINAEQALAAVRKLAAQLDSDVKRASGQLGSLPDITSFLLNPRKMFDMLGNTGRQDGLRQAAVIVRKFLNEAGS